MHFLHPCWDLEEGGVSIRPSSGCLQQEKEQRTPSASVVGDILSLAGTPLFTHTDPGNACCCTHFSDRHLRPREGPGNTSLHTSLCGWAPGHH